MKNQQITFLKRFFILFAVTFLFAESSFAETSNFCSKVSKSYENKLSQTFKQSPMVFIEQLLEESKKEVSNPANQNKLISASFDLRRVYRANAKSFKSKIVTNSLFNWIRLQFFGNLNKNYIEKSSFLAKKNVDLLSERERLNMKNFKPLWTAVEKVKCSKQEMTHLGCKKSVFKMTVQFLPEVSCKNRDSQRAFESEFLLTYSAKYGFKILDVKLSGKRIVLDSIDMMLGLKKSGFNKNAISEQLNLLAQGNNSFRIPRKQVHSGRFLAKYRMRSQQQEQNRAPASL